MDGGRKLRHATAVGDDPLALVNSCIQRYKWMEEESYVMLRQWEMNPLRLSIAVFKGISGQSVDISPM